MSLEHPITKLIFDSLVHSPNGFDLDPKKAPVIANQLKTDPSATTAFHETLGLLELSNGRPAADALRQLIIDGQSPAAKTGKGWGAR